MDIEKLQLILVGGKRLNLGELSKIEELQVPVGFTITTVGYLKSHRTKRNITCLFYQLLMVKVEDRDKMAEITKKIRQIILVADVYLLEIREYVQHERLIKPGGILQWLQKTLLCMKN